MPAHYKSLDQRLAEYAVEIPEAGCWIWTGYSNTDGYGVACMTIDGVKKNRLVHRLVYAHFVGPVPDDVLVCHRCDTPSCVNPKHLFLGTPQDNVDDMMRKGRFDPGPRDNTGERNPNRKISEQEVRQIRERYVRGARTGSGAVSNIAADFCLHRTSVQRIVSGKRWSHV